MFVPLHDKNPLKSISFQYMTVGLIAFNLVVFAVFLSGWVYTLDERLIAFALVPSELMAKGSLLSDHVRVSEGAWPIQERWTLITYMFVHGNLWHLLGNMLFLWVFGDNVEDAMGHWRFLFFYIICGVFAALTHVMIQPGSNIPMIGASGAVAGIVAAYLMLHPKVKIWVLALWPIPFKLSAMWVLGFWVLLQLFSALTSSGEGIAWWAHVGGLAAGAVLILFMRRRGVQLFDQTQGGA